MVGTIEPCLTIQEFYIWEFDYICIRVYNISNGQVHYCKILIKVY